MHKCARARCSHLLCVCAFMGVCVRVSMQVVCEELKISSQNDTVKLAEAKNRVYLKVCVCVCLCVCFSVPSQYTTITVVLTGVWPIIPQYTSDGPPEIMVCCTGVSCTGARVCVRFPCLVPLVTPSQMPSSLHVTVVYVTHTSTCRVSQTAS